MKKTFLKLLFSIFFVFLFSDVFAQEPMVLDWEQTDCWLLIGSSSSSDYCTYPEITGIVNFEDYDGATWKIVINATDSYGNNAWVDGQFEVYGPYPDPRMVINMYDAPPVTMRYRVYLNGWKYDDRSYIINIEDVKDFGPF